MSIQKRQLLQQPSRNVLRCKSLQVAPLSTALQLYYRPLNLFYASYLTQNLPEGNLAKQREKYFPIKR